MCGDIFCSPSWEQGNPNRPLGLASSGSRPQMLSNILQCTGHTMNYPASTLHWNIASWAFVNKIRVLNLISILKKPMVFLLHKETVS